MKTSRVFFLLIIVTFLFPGFAQAIDRETLWSRLEFSGSNDKYIETIKIAKQNLGLVEEILFLSDFVRANDTARFHSLRILKQSSEEGLLANERFFEICSRLYSQISSVAHPKEIVDSKNDIKAVLANFGDNAGYPLSQQISGFSSLVTSLFNTGFITNQGILNSLQQKITNAQKSFDKKGPEAKSSATKQVEAVINELNAQRGKHVTEDGYQILSGYCKTLIIKIQNTNQ